MKIHKNTTLEEEFEEKLLDLYAFAFLEEGNNIKGKEENINTVKDFISTHYISKEKLQDIIEKDNWEQSGITLQERLQSLLNNKEK